MDSSVELQRGMWSSGLCEKHSETMPFGVNFCLRDFIKTSNSREDISKKEEVL